MNNEYIDRIFEMIVVGKDRKKNIVEKIKFIYSRDFLIKYVFISIIQNLIKFNENEKNTNFIYYDVVY